MEFPSFPQLLEHHWGTWVCQRTRFYLDGTPANHGKAQLQITGLAPASGLGMVFTWSENNRPVAVTTLTFDPDAQQFRQDNGTGASRTGYYTWNPAGVMELTLALASGQSVTERLWFASANLRLRTVLVRRDQGLESVAFYSDIRRVAAP